MHPGIPLKQPLFVQGLHKSHPIRFVATVGKYANYIFWLPKLFELDCQANLSKRAWHLLDIYGILLICHK